MAKSEPRNRRKKKQGSGNEDIISMTNVTKSYATGAPALNGIDLHIKPGEFVFIVGDSGSGKSTMIKLLLRELVPTSGEISVMGYDLLKIRHRKIHENGTTVLVVTHNREIVNAMQKRVVTMKKGIIVSDEEKGVYIDED